MKTNPYVGTFRHAPPALVYGRKRGRFQKNKHVVSRKERRTRYDDTDRVTVIDALDLSRRHSRLKILDGRLLGGGHDKMIQYSKECKGYPFMTCHDSRRMSEVTSALPHTTLGVTPITQSPISGQHRISFPPKFSLYSLIFRFSSLLRGSWLLDDIGHSDELSAMDWKDKGNQSNVEDEEYDNSDCDEFSTKSMSSCCKSTSQGSSVTNDYRISLEVLQDFLDGCASYDGGERMDYVITQTDIARMARCTSRHLDVASILSLPTITYRSPPPKMVTIKTEDANILEGEKNELAETSQINGMWSWMMISRDGQDAISTEQWDCQEEVLEHLDQDCCVICLENFTDGEKLRVLPCNHFFHPGCIDHWLLGTYSDYECVTSGCPMCKKRAATIAEEVISAIGAVPSWAFTRLGGALAKESFQQGIEQNFTSPKEDGSLPSSVSSSV